jgi:hypothetical protein
MEQINIMILCTGNPTHSTIASAVKTVFPTAEFASRVSGYDLRFWDPGSESHFREQIKKYNTLINSSFICGNGQLALLETTHQAWTENNISGHIINIGSTAEWLGIDSAFEMYSIQKRALRDRSLQLNGKNNIKTTHIIVGGLNDGKPGHEHWLDLIHIATTIKWILSNPYQVPLIEIQACADK